MQIVHSLVGAVLGTTLLAAVACATQLRRSGLRSAVGAFSFTCLCAAAVATAQLVRIDATSLPLMDATTRLLQGPAMLAIWGFHEVYRHLCRVPQSRSGRALGWATGAAAAYALASPGGILFGRVTAVGERPLPWGEVLHFPVGTPDPIAGAYLLVCAVASTRLLGYSALRWRQGARAHAGMMGVGAAGLAALVVMTGAAALGYYRGPIFSEMAILVLFAVGGWQVADTQGRLGRERDEALRLARVNGDKLAAMLDQSQTLAGLLTPDGVLVHANRRALQLAGASAEAVIGRPFVDGPWWRHSSALRLRLAEAIAGAARGETERFRASLRDAGGGALEFDFTLSAYRNAAGRVEWVVPEGRDVTEITRFEERARQEQRLEVMGQLAGGVAHDFNNMLTVILAAAEEARASASGPALQESLGAIVEASQRAAGLTRQLLTFARRGSTRSEVFSVHEALLSATELFGRTAGPTVSVVRRFGAVSEDVRGDRSLLESALMNLLVNARDAMPDGGTITVSTADSHLEARAARRFAQPLEPGAYVRVEIADTGSGIPQQLQPRIFEPFFTTKGPGKGTGLGLAAVLGCLRDFRGGVDVVSRVGEGTAFALFLPVAALGTAAEPIPTRPVLRAAGATALLVDDEPIVRNTISRVLGQLGLVAATAGGGAQALEQVRSGAAPPSVALVDLQMPGMNGVELARAMRALQPQLPIVLSSGNFSDWDLAEFEGDPLVRVLGKPYRREELAQALAELGVLSRESQGDASGAREP